MLAGMVMLKSMPYSTRSSGSITNVLAVVMGGGQGTRLSPLTKLRSKPAVPLGAKYRLVDIPISNCINSDLRRIYILTQFNSASLHRHIIETYHFDHFSNGFVEICAAQQTLDNMGWYQGTADAVRQNMRYFNDHRPDYIVILSGDQLYRMDFRKLLRQHIETYADLTVSVLPVRRKTASSLGILQTNEEKRIVRFAEKPKEAAVLDELKVVDPLLSNLGITSSEDHYLASMGIYVFSRKVLEEALDNNRADFGKDIIPAAIKTHRVFAYIYQGYWEDIGTIGAFFEANLDFARPRPQFDFYDRNAPIYTRSRYLPASQVTGGNFNDALIADGCRIGRNVRIDRGMIGIRSIIQSNCHLEDCVMMGNDSYEDNQMRNENEARGNPHMGIGEGCTIRRAIIDKNVQIGEGCVITPDGKTGDIDHELYSIRDGIVVVPKNTIIPAGTKI
jgi:glucose-1-phosphate adenylyltransferase